MYHLLCCLVYIIMLLVDIHEPPKGREIKAHVPSTVLFSVYNNASSGYS